VGVIGFPTSDLRLPICLRSEVEESPIMKCVSTERTGQRVRIAPSIVRKIASGRLSDLRNGAHEFGEIFAVTRGMIEGVEARVHCGFRQGDAV
jgi:hypothetical protein